MTLEPHPVLRCDLLGGDHQHRNLSPSLVRAQLRHELESVHHGHHQVEQDNVWEIIAEAVERFPAGAFYSAVVEPRFAEQVLLAGAAAARRAAGAASGERSVVDTTPLALPKTYGNVVLSSFPLMKTEAAKKMKPLKRMKRL